MGYLIGRWLDGQFETRPWLTMAFTVFGLVAGFRALWRAARRAMVEDAAADAANGRKSTDDDGSGTAGT